MKKVLTVLLAVCLLATLALALCACEEKQEGPATNVSDYKSKGTYTKLNDPLCWEKVNSFPIVSDDTTIEEGRQMVVDFFRFAKTAPWIPSETYNFVDESYIEGDVPFGGLPYISLASGNIYRLMDYMDQETNVVDVTRAGAKPTLHGNQCSFGSYVGWGRVINSMTYNWTVGMVIENGYLPVGDYEYDQITRFGGAHTTTNIMAELGQEKMFECYAQLKHGDGLVYYTTAGHVIMCASDPHVEYASDGRIDASKSYITIIEQSYIIRDGQNEAGDSYKYEESVDLKMTFLTLFQKHYLPFTFAEWLGTDPIEKSVTTYSHTGDTISLNELYKSAVTSNYGVSDVYASFYDKNGNEVYKLARRAEEAGMHEIDFKKAGFEVEQWGSPDDLDPKKDYTVKVYAQISTGERPVLWEGKLAQ